MAGRQQSRVRLFRLSRGQARSEDCRRLVCACGWEAVFNRNSTMFKEMPEAEQDIDKTRARKIILAETNLIKRPVLDTGDTLVFGFKPETFGAALEKWSSRRK